jgi:hypothetical protein
VSKSIGYDLSKWRRVGYDPLPRIAYPQSISPKKEKKKNQKNKMK